MLEQQIIGAFPAVLVAQQHLSTEIVVVLVEAVTELGVAHNREMVALVFQAAVAELLGQVRQYFLQLPETAVQV
jgi:hypothetical protein